MKLLRVFMPTMICMPLWAGISGGTARAASPELSAANAAIPDTQPAAKPLFDPSRHMHVSEVTPGMVGYGLTVFHGSKIERFDVEVLAVLKNFNPKSDVVLIRCKGAYLEHTGSIAGMSGSPIFLRDAAGHDRMIGAFAYGWPLTKDPVAGVQPIEYMLQLPSARRAGSPGAGDIPAALPSSAPRTQVGNGRTSQQASWSLAEAGLLPVPWKTVSPGPLATEARRGENAGPLLGDGTVPRLQPLATPLMTSGMPPRLFEALAPRFRAAGLVPLQAGAGGSAAGALPEAKLEPGSVLAVPLLTGDMEMTAIGTTTEVLGDRVWGFGHPFNNEGAIALPMGSGVINGVIANLTTSFKLGSLTHLRGTLTTDGSVGVAGEEGTAPATIPIDIAVQPADGSGARTYHFNASRHAKFTPLLSAAAFAAAMTGSSELPQYNTVDYNLDLSFSNGQTVSLSNRSVNGTAGDLFGDAAVVMQAAADNPFQRVMVKRITGSVNVRPIVESAQIIDVNLPRSHYHPGDKLKAFVSYQPFRGEEAILPVDLDLPRDLARGEYKVVISDAQRYFADEQQARPFRFTAENIADVFTVLKEVAAIRENAIYVRLLRRPDGVAVGHTALSHLPSSRREILLDSGRSNTTPFIGSTVKIVPTDLVMSGSSEFTIEVETASKPLVGAPRSARTEPPTLNVPARTDEPKKSQSSPETPGKKDAPKESAPGQ